MIGQEKTGSRCATGGLNWISGKLFSPKDVVQHQHRLPRVMVESPFLEGFNRCVHVALGLVMALAELGEQLDLMMMESFSHLNDSVILCLFRVLTWAAKNS